MPLFPTDELEALLILKASNGSAISYGEVFGWFGHRFQRFQVGQLCAALEEVDSLQRGRGRPELASLVVRASDGIPGQGWWLSKSHDAWDGLFVGPEAAAFVRRHQKRAFDYWDEDVRAAATSAAARPGQHAEIQAGPSRRKAIEGDGT